MNMCSCLLNSLQRKHSCSALIAVFIKPCALGQENKATSSACQPWKPKSIWIRCQGLMLWSATAITRNFTGIHPSFLPITSFPISLFGFLELLHISMEGGTKMPERIRQNKNEISLSSGVCLSVPPLLFRAWFGTNKGLAVLWWTGLANKVYFHGGTQAWPCPDWPLGSALASTQMSATQCGRRTDYQGWAPKNKYARQHCGLDLKQQWHVAIREESTWKSVFIPNDSSSSATFTVWIKMGSDLLYQAAVEMKTWVQLTAIHKPTTMYPQRRNWVPIWSNELLLDVSELQWDCFLHIKSFFKEKGSLFLWMEGKSCRGACGSQSKSLVKVVILLLLYFWNNIEWHM